MYGIANCYFDVRVALYSPSFTVESTLLWQQCSCHLMTCLQQWVMYGNDTCSGCIPWLYELKFSLKKKLWCFCSVIALFTLMSSGCNLHNLKVIIFNFGLRTGSPFHKSHYSRRCLLQLFVNTMCPLAAWRLLFLFLMMPSAHPMAMVVFTMVPFTEWTFK